MIMRSNILRAAAVAAFAIFTVACDGGNPSRTADEFAADSALAADLALANRDTLLVDSIGAYREPDAAERGTSAAPAAASPPPAVAAPASAPPRANFSDAASSGTSQPNRVVPATPSEIPKPAPTTTAPATVPSVPPPTTATATPKPPAPRLTGTRACSSSTPENQAECIRVSIAAGDARLNRIYRALITEMRLQEKVPAGAKDPPSVQRVRVAQRQWIVYRDNECRKKVPAKTKGLWAKARANCLAEFAGRRAGELADDFSKLTAH